MDVAEQQLPMNNNVTTPTQESQVTIKTIFRSFLFLSKYNFFFFFPLLTAPVC